SMYGYMGFFGARWYSIACATSITSYGRNYITSVIKRAQDKGFKVLYSDTDSIFLSLDGKKKEDATDFANEINKNLPGLMELDYEGYYPTGLFVATKESGEGAKKKYALLSENGNIKIKGFEAVRRNLSKIAKEAQERTISIILKENDREKATEYIRETVNALRQRTIPAEKTIISTQLQKDVTSYDAISPHVAVAQKMIQQGKTVATGSVISYIVTAGKDRIRERAKPPSEVKGNEYDPEYYINNQILPSVKKIFDVLGIDIILETEPKTQKKLDAFFG
ncbi:DNA polymerase, partial [Candidatus Woesearchaeota archaeon]|nr:DNA polymerase [Candidatus Woesearchaeota archaeon]